MHNSGRARTPDGLGEKDGLGQGAVPRMWPYFCATKYFNEISLPHPNVTALYCPAASASLLNI